MLELLELEDELEELLLEELLLEELLELEEELAAVPEELELLEDELELELLDEELELVVDELEPPQASPVTTGVEPALLPFLATWKPKSTELPGWIFAFQASP